MHILLTDVLACPRCGPEFGLIVLADRIEARRVQEGQLGCANCREGYPVQGGVADLRGGGEETRPEGGTGPDRAFRTAALLGIGDAQGIVLLVGAEAALADEVSALIPQVEVASVVADGSPAPSRGSRLRVSDRLPFRDRSLRGVALLGTTPEALLAEAARVLRPDAHLVLDPAPEGAREILEKRGLRILLEEQGVVVASPSPPG